MALPNEYDLAEAFAGLVSETIRGADFAELIELNEAETNPSVCHTHDFCDANELMLVAWRELDPSTTLDEIMHNSVASVIWNDAWQIAKADKFDVASIRSTKSL